MFIPIYSIRKKWNNLPLWLLIFLYETSESLATRHCIIALRRLRLTDTRVMVPTHKSKGMEYVQTCIISTAGGQTRKSSGDGELSARSLATGGTGAGDAGLVRNSFGTNHVRYFRRLFGRIRPAGASLGESRSRLDGQSAGISRRTARHRKGLRPCAQIPPTRLIP